MLLSLESKEIKINTRKRPGDRPFLVFFKKECELLKRVNGLLDLVERKGAGNKFGLTGLGVKNDGARGASDTSCFSS